MFDFYLIEDEEARPNYPEQSQLQFAGSLDEKTFSNLKLKGLIGNQFDYYSDFRWGTAIIVQMRQHIIRRQITNDSDVKHLISLLDIAEKNETGLIAYSD